MEMFQNDWHFLKFMNSQKIANLFKSMNNYQIQKKIQVHKHFQIHECFKFHGLFFNLWSFKFKNFVSINDFFAIPQTFLKYANFLQIQIFLCSLTFWVHNCFWNNIFYKLMNQKNMLASLVLKTEEWKKLAWCQFLLKKKLSRPRVQANLRKDDPTNSELA